MLLWTVTDMHVLCRSLASDGPDGGYTRNLIERNRRPALKFVKHDHF